MKISRRSALFGGAAAVAAVPAAAKAASEASEFGWTRVVGSVMATPDHPDFDRLENCVNVDIDPSGHPVLARGPFIATAGERVMDAKTRKVICRVKVDIDPSGLMSAEDFGDFAEGEAPFCKGESIDRRCIRLAQNGKGAQLFVEGEWRGGGNYVYRALGAVAAGDPVKVIEVFHHPDGGTFWSRESDLSDLGGEYLEIAKRQREARCQRAAPRA